MGNHGTVKSAFVADKTLGDLSSQFQLPFGKQWLDIYIWNSTEGLLNNTRFKNRDYLGAYVSCWNGKKTGLFGEVHLVKDIIGGGYVAHELQHFIYDYMLWCPTNFSDRLNEKLAKLLGEITNLFWREFYDRYK
jgi:hypothetical protein